MSRHDPMCNDNHHAINIYYRRRGIPVGNFFNLLMFVVHYPGAVLLSLQLINRSALLNLNASKE